MSIKGYPSQKKLSSDLIGFTSSQSETRSQFVTFQPTASDKVLQDVAINGLYRTHLSPKTLLAGATYPKRQLILTAHGAKKNDVIRFEDTSSNPGFEANVLSVPDANTIILGSELEVDSVAGDTLYILRHITPRYEKDGSINVAAVLSQASIPVDLKLVDTSTTNISNAAYTQIVASAPVNYGEIEVLNETGVFLVLAFGAAGFESNKIYIPPSGLKRQAVSIPAGTRLSLKAVQAITANAGIVAINAFA